jgi:aerobic-type carbon monoxide dehydrogenase small subunit (CoxS/CutS family)
MSDKTKATGLAMKLRVNGETHEIDADPATPLIFVLRNTLGLTGVKLGCGLEQCGACAVLADGQSTLSCSKGISEFAGKDIVTIEGLAGSAVQAAFVRENAAQCGYCTPGIVVAVTALLAKQPKPDRAAVNDALDKHLCRCGSHPRVLRAIKRLSEEAARG